MDDPIPESAHGDPDQAPDYTWSDADSGAPVRPPRWVLPVLTVPILGLIVANNVGAVLLTSSLHTRGSTVFLSHPLRILALNSTNKVLLAAGFQTTMVWFVVISTLRLLAPDPLFYLLGLLYRAPALRWGRRVYPGAGRLFDMFEAEDHVGVRRLLDVLVVIMPNNPVCLLAGVAAMPWRRFAVLNLVGTVGRTVLFFGLSHAFKDQIRSIMNWVASYQKWALGLTVAVVVVTLAVQARRFMGSTEALADGD